MTALGFDFKSVLEQSVADVTTTIVISVADWTRYIQPLSDDFYCMLLSVSNREIVKVDRSASVSPNLVVARGQEGTSARDWPRGTLIYHDITAAALGEIEQESSFREVAFNPNGALTSDFFGEKVYQTDLHLWWKAVAEGTSEWRLIAGEIFIDDVDFDPVPGTYSSGQQITMTVLAPGATIYYTDDGSDPDETDNEYISPFVIPASTTYKARAFGANRWESPSQNITSGEYIITTEDWQEIIGIAGETGDQIISLVVYNSKLYGYSDTSGKLYEYDGDGSPGWTMVADTPSGFVGSGEATCNGNHIWAVDGGRLLRWGTGDGAWTVITSVYSNFYFPLSYSDTHLFVSASNTHYRYKISDNTWGVLATSVATVNFGSTPQVVTAWGDVLCLSYGMCYEFTDSTYGYNIYSPTGENTWLRGADNLGAYTYVGVQNGSLYQYNKTGSWTEKINASWGTYALIDLRSQSIMGNSRIWALNCSPISTPDLYSYNGAGSSWVYETGNGGLSGSFTNATCMVAFNGTLYVSNDDGRLAKYIGE